MEPWVELPQRRSGVFVTSLAVPGEKGARHAPNTPINFNNIPHARNSEASGPRLTRELFPPHTSGRFYSMGYLPFPESARRALDIAPRTCVNRSMLRETQITLAMACILLFLATSYVDARPEREYQEEWCASMGGEVEVVLADRTRCDCVTDTHAIEVEFARNWHSAVGQALWYAAQTSKRPGIVLIIDANSSDEKYWIKLNVLVDAYELPIDLWKINISGGYVQ